MLAQILKRIAIGVGLATLLVIAVGFVLPRTYTVERSVTIAAEPGHIHRFVGSDPQSTCRINSGGIDLLTASIGYQNASRSGRISISIVQAERSCSIKCMQV